MRKDLADPAIGVAAGLGGARPHPDRAAVGRQQFDVDDGQTRRGERALRREHRVVLEVLVVDRVELAELHQVQRVVHLDAQPAVVGEQVAQRPR